MYLGLIPRYLPALSLSLRLDTYLTSWSMHSPVFVSLTCCARSSTSFCCASAATSNRSRYSPSSSLTCLVTYGPKIIAERSTWTMIRAINSLSTVSAFRRLGSLVGIKSLSPLSPQLPCVRDGSNVNREPGVLRVIGSSSALRFRGVAATDVSIPTHRDRAGLNRDG